MTVQVVAGGTLRCEKTWRNVGGAGYRDILVAYGKGISPDDFSAEKVQLARNEYAGAGAQVTTTVDTRIAEGVEPGVRDALVAVGKWDDATSNFWPDDYEVVPDAIEVVAATPAQITIGFRGRNYPAWVTEEEIIVWDGAIQSSGRHSPGTTAYFTIPGGLELVHFQFNLWGSLYPDGIGAASALGPPQDGSVYTIDITMFFGFKALVQEVKRV